MNEEMELFSFIDSHAHYDDPSFNEDREELIATLPQKGIIGVVNIASDQKSLAEVQRLADQYDFFYCTQGIHPSDCGEAEESVLEYMRESVKKNPKIVAIGEIGLDYHWKEPSPDLQKAWFAKQLELARELGKPVVIHSRDAALDTIRILKENHAEDVGGVIHCYSYKKEEVPGFLEMGFYFGIGGVATFKNAKKIKEALAVIPIDRIVLETDSPYLSPEPFRGKRNDSTKLIYVAHALSQIKQLSLSEISEITTDNVKNLYRIK